jgi:hypothetical protein
MPGLVKKGQISESTSAFQISDEVQRNEPARASQMLKESAEERVSTQSKLEDTGEISGMGVSVP